MGIVPVVLRRKHEANGPGRRVPLWVKIIIGVCVLFILGIIGINIYLKTTVNNRLKAIVRESTHGLYKLDYSGLSLNALTGSFTIRDVRLTPDTAVLNKLLQQHAAPRFVYEGTIARLALSNVRWLIYINNKNLNIGKVKLTQPRFNITQYLQKNDTAREMASIENTFGKQVRNLRVARFSVENAMVNYQVVDTVDVDRTINLVEGLDIDLEDLKLKKTKGNVPELTVDEHNITLKEFKHRTADSLYWIGMKGLHYSSHQKKATLALFYTQPRYPEKEFARKHANQQTRYQLELKNLSAENLDLATLLLKGQAIMKKVSIESGSANMFMDRSLPARGKDEGEVMISKKIRKIVVPFAIDQLTIGKLAVNYSEFNPSTGQSARIPFQNLSITATNITNLPERISRNPKLTLDATGQFMNAQIKTNFAFDLGSNDGNFTSTVTANEIPARELSPILTAIAKIETRKGTLEKLDATVTGNEQGATANVILRYRGLKISMLKKEGDTLKRRGLPTMLANLFVVDDNPKDGVLRTAQSMRLVRKPGRSFFNMLWGVIALGIKDIITDKKGHKLDAV
jgi:hypothetical protein